MPPNNKVKKQDRRIRDTRGDDDRERAPFGEAVTDHTCDMFAAEVEDPTSRQTRVMLRAVRAVAFVLALVLLAVGTRRPGVLMVALFAGAFIWIFKQRNGEEEQALPEDVEPSREIAAVLRESADEEAVEGEQEVLVLPAHVLQEKLSTRRRTHCRRCDREDDRGAEYCATCGQPVS